MYQRLDFVNDGIVWMVAGHMRRLLLFRASIFRSGGSRGLLTNFRQIMANFGNERLQAIDYREINKVSLA